MTKKQAAAGKHYLRIQVLKSDGDIVQGWEEAVGDRAARLVDLSLKPLDLEPGYTVLYLSREPVENPRAE